MRQALVALMLWCLAAAFAPARAADEDKSTGVAEASQQVLVLLRMPPEHFRPDGNYSGGYGDGLSRSARRRVAQQLAREHGLTLASDWPMPLLGVDCYVMAVPASHVPEQVAQMLSHDARVEWAQAMNVYRAQQAQVTQATTARRGQGDPLYAVQPAARAWRLAELHELATGRDVRVAVIDSGIERNHPDLAGQIARAENFLPGAMPAAEQHGTGVAGLIAAHAGNGMGIVGVAPRARLLALRACWQTDGPASTTTLCTSLSLAVALHFAIQHDAQVINLSLAGPPDRLLARLIDIALARDITVVAAFDRGLPGGGFPASLAGVVAVAAEGSDGADAMPAASVLLAPGRDLPTAAPGARWLLVSGASYAAAQVSGLFALLRELRPAGLVNTASALVVHTPGGGIDTCATLMRAMRNSGPCACACDAAQAGSPLAARQ